MMHRRTQQQQSRPVPSPTPGTATTAAAATARTTTTTTRDTSSPSTISKAKMQMEMEPHPQPNTTTSTITNESNGNGNSNSSSGMSSLLPLTNTADDPLGTTLPQQRRRRKIKTTAFSKHYLNGPSTMTRKREKGSSSNSGSSGSVGVLEDCKCLIGILFLLIGFIFVGLVIIYNLLQTRDHNLPIKLPTKSSSSSTTKTTTIQKIDYSKQQRQPKRQQGNNNEDTELFEPLPSSDIYVIPNSMSHIGDKSDEYAQLRLNYDDLHPYNPKRSLQATKALHKNKYQAYDNPLGYDIYNCPEEPPEGYPYQWKTLTILNHWHPHDTDPPENDMNISKIHQGLCQFDYAKDYIKILRYRRLEVPFVVRNDPMVAQTVERWNTPNYMQQLLGNVMHRAEYSKNNHFLYWMPSKEQSNGAARIEKKIPPGWEEPTKLIRMTYQDWLNHANVTDTTLADPDRPHWYFRLIGCGETGPKGDCDKGSSEYLFDELPFFQPRPDGLYLVDSELQKGIHCRFGMRGVIAENHFDASRNAIVILGGERRYILSHPNQCRNLALFPKKHPSARHSAVDWTNPNLDEYPEFADAMSNEVVLQAGDVLYLPTNWFHYIISLNVNFQCNTRSGTSNEYWDPIHKCGF